MPAKRSHGEFAPLPSTLERSPKKAAETYEQTLKQAEAEYGGDEARAHRVAWGAVKHSFEKSGDHWEAKQEKGPSDPQSASGGPAPKGRSYGGVNAAKDKSELLADAKHMGVAASTHDTKAQIAEKIAHENTRQTRSRRAAEKK